MVRDNLTQKQVIEIFKDLAIKHSNAAEESNHRKANRIFAKLEVLVSRFHQDKVLEESVITNLLSDRDIRIKAQAAMKSLRLNKHIEEALDILNETAMQEDYKILRVDAHMALKVWKERGNFKFH